MTSTSYNGLSLSDEWPPQHINLDSRRPLSVPYLASPPACVPIDLGRQLFIDDFLIEKTDAERVFHAAQADAASPILKPETAMELNDGHCPVAAPFNDGICYDPQDQLYKMWYQAGWFDGTALAISTDGINWQRPAFDVIPGTNAVVTHAPDFIRDGSCVWLDHEAPDPGQRFKNVFILSTSGWRAA